MPSVICPVVGISQVFSWTSLSGPRVRVLPPLSPTTFSYQTNTRIRDGEQKEGEVVGACCFSYLLLLVSLLVCSIPRIPQLETEERGARHSASWEGCFEV